MANDHIAHKTAEMAMGAVQELAGRGGMNLGHGHGVGGKAGELLVSGAAMIAPVAVAKAGVVTAAAFAAGTAAATVAAPFVLLGAVGYGVYRLTRGR